MATSKKFYDIHMHSFDLSHPNLSVFLQREDLIDSLLQTTDEPDDNPSKKNWACSISMKCNLCTAIVFISLMPLSILLISLVFVVLALFIAAAPLILLFLIVFGIIAYKKSISLIKSSKNILKKGLYFLLALPFIKKQIERIKRTITFFEIPHEYQFLIIEHFLKKSFSNNQITVDNDVYNKIVLCPLIIDFGYKNIHEGITYNLTPKHPIAKQTGDIFYAIRTYFRFELKEKQEEKRFRLSQENPDWYKKEEKEKKLFEIYPFMGLNTQNYSLDELKDLLDKFFIKFSEDKKASDRKSKLFEKMGMLDSNMYRDKEIENLTEEKKEFWKDNHIASDYQHAFAGIKVYPQLGFDPFPEDDSWEFEKVKYLYKYCIDKRIPITTHCSDGGYKTDDNDKLTSPSKWEKVLAYQYEDEKSKEVIKFEKLTLNFAHFGCQKKGKTDWKNDIIKLIKKYDNVYTDISCKDKKYYNSLKNDLEDEILQNRILFGSDFSINMLVTETGSYNENLQNFIKANLNHKANICEQNPERFLFGEISGES